MKPTIGCYIDGADQPQIEGDARTVRLTEDFGRVLDRETSNFCRRVEMGVATESDYETCADFSTESEEWLNGNAGPTYAYWGWNDGNFGLWPVEYAKEDLFTSSKKEDYPPADYKGHWLHVSDHGNCTLYLRQDGNDAEIWSVV